MSTALRQTLHRQAGEDDADVVDRMPRPLRQLAHEYGISTVRAFVDSDVTDPRKIAFLIHNVFLGAREPGNRRPAGSNSGLEQQIGLLLMRTGSTCGPRMFLRELREGGLTIAPIEPDDAMVEASLRALDNVGLVNRHTKHRARLRAALKTAAKHHFPWLWGSL